LRRRLRNRSHERGGSASLQLVCSIIPRIIAGPMLLSSGRSAAGTHLRSCTHLRSRGLFPCVQKPWMSVRSGFSLVASQGAPNSQAVAASRRSLLHTTGSLLFGAGIGAGVLRTPVATAATSAVEKVRCRARKRAARALDVSVTCSRQQLWDAMSHTLPSNLPTSPSAHCVALNATANRPDGFYRSARSWRTPSGQSGSRSVRTTS
jgi:hypothetical protein